MERLKVRDECTCFPTESHLRGDADRWEFAFPELVVLDFCETREINNLLTW